VAEPSARDARLPDGARRDSTFFMALLGATVLLYVVSIPLAFGMVATGPAAAFFGIRAVYRSRGAASITAFRYATIAGVLMALFGAFMGVVLMVFHEPVQALRDCMGRALTHSAEAQCQAEYEADVQQLMEDALERMGITLP